MIEKNTVVLDIDRYNELRDFKENLERDNVRRISNATSNRYQQYNVIEYIDVNDALNEIEEINRINVEVNIKLKNDIYELNKIITDGNKKVSNPIKIEDFKKMSIWDFFKWKKNNK